MGRNDSSRELGSDPSEGKSHPVGKTLGGAAGAVAGGIAGSPGGPITAAAGAAIGALAGWLEGKTIAEGINPDVEISYWEKNYSQRPYYKSGRKFEDYRPAYMTGMYSFDEGDTDDDFSLTENELRKNWDSIRGESKLSADEAVSASKDAWMRVRKPH